MRRLPFSPAALALIWLLASCGPGAAGPSSWIDVPLDNSKIPVGSPLTIQAHASSGLGVDRIEFFIDEASLQSISTTGERLGAAELEWTPQVAGTFEIRVQAYDSNGQAGAFAIKQVEVLSPQAFALVTPTSELFLEPTPSAEAQPVGTTFAFINQVECGPDGVVYADIVLGHPQGISTYSLFSTWVEASSGETFTEVLPTLIQKRVQLTEPYPDDIDRNHQVGLRVEFVGQDPFFTYADEPGNRCPGHYEPVTVETEQKAPVVTARQNSNCRAGTSSVFPIMAVLLTGDSAEVEAADAAGSWLRIKPPNGSPSCWIAANLVEVDGDLSTVPTVPTPIPPQASPTAAPSPTDAPDTTPPTINSVQVSPASILTPGGGCPSDARTATVTVSASDASGIGKVLVFWNLAGDSGQSALSSIGGGSWQGQAGPVSKVGTLNLFVNVEDGAGNDTLSDVLNVQVQNCPG